jgi:hypothetical protein
MQKSTVIGHAAIFLLMIFALLGPGTALAGDPIVECPIATTACTAEELMALPKANYSSPSHFLTLAPAGYSDFGIVTRGSYPQIDPRDPGGPPPLHEMMSGEFATAISHDGMPIQWTQECWEYPNFRAPTNWMVETGPSFIDDPDADGFLEGKSSVINPYLRLTVNYDWVDTGTGVAMGRGLLGGASYQMSDRFVLHLRYDIENITANPVNDVNFVQFGHTHPGNAETSITDIVFDDFMHIGGAYQDYHYDLTTVATNSGLTDNYPTSSSFLDHVGISSNMMPSDWGLGTFGGHSPIDPGIDPASGRPLSGLHCDVEANTLGNETILQQVEAAGAMQWNLGNIGPGQIVSVDVLFTFHTRSFGQPADACLEITESRVAPVLHMSKGLCKDPGPSKTPVDIARGSIRDVFTAPGCGTDLNCIVLTRLDCLSYGYGFSRFSLDDDAHRLDPLKYYIVRYSGTPFLDWGLGDIPFDGNPWLRVTGTPQTAPGIDACIP